MPYTIFKDFAFAAAHRIPDHPGKCRHVHGHNYRVRVHLRAARLDALGMVLDFAELKGYLQQILEPFDHRVINEIPPFTERNPTSELLAEHVFHGVRERLDDPDRVQVTRVEVWENDTCGAVYEP